MGDAPRHPGLQERDYMKNTKLTLLAIAFVPAIVAWTVGGTTAKLQPGSRLWVAGTSTVKDFTCQAKVVDAAIGTNGTNAAREVIGGSKSVTLLTVKVRPANLDCANKTMNEHMLKALKSDAFPVIEFKMLSYDIAKGATTTNGRLTGTLTLGGVQKQISFDAIGTAPASGALRVTGTYPILMSDYGLKAPSLMMGTMKVNPRVKVNFDLLVK
jgi:polyisoprenoid-binding protein YceI